MTQLTHPERLGTVQPETSGKVQSSQCKKNEPASQQDEDAERADMKRVGRLSAIFAATLLVGLFASVGLIAHNNSEHANTNGQAQPNPPMVR